MPTAGPQFYACEAKNFGKSHVKNFGVSIQDGISPPLYLVEAPFSSQHRYQTTKPHPFSPSSLPIPGFYLDIRPSLQFSIISIPVNAISEEMLLSFISWCGDLC